MGLEYLDPLFNHPWPFLGHYASPKQLVSDTEPDWPCLGIVRLMAPGWSPAGARC